MGADWKLSGVTVIAEGTDKKKLLEDIHAVFKAGEITLLIGRNGAGKSTLLETMAGIREIETGTVKLGDDDLWVKEKRRKRLNRNASLRYGIAMQSSESQWFAATVRDEFMYSLKPYGVDDECAAKRIEYALAEVGLPQETMERDPWTLSGGQQRRLSLACLLACETDWLLLDEPTAGLDAVGIRRLCAVLEAHRAAGRGAVVATHDLDALLPLADAVAVVSGGTVRAAAPAAAVVHDAAVPQALRTQAELRAVAALPPLEPAPGSGAPWPGPRETAAAIVAELARQAKERDAVVTGINGRLANALESRNDKSILLVNTEYSQDKRQDDVGFSGRTAKPASTVTNERKTHVAAPALKGPKLLRSDRFDPRAIILVYLFLAACLLAQKTAVELSLAALVILFLLAPFRALIWPWIRVIRAYAVMILIFCVIGGIGFQPLSFDLDKVGPIALRFGKLLLVMVLSMPMLKLMTPFRLQRAIEQTFGFLERIRVPIHSFALIVTLIFRFIPLLTGEWERFAKLAHARGKAVTPLKTVPFKNLVPILIPYVRSVLRLAEQMADALEARGFGYKKRKPTYAFRLRFGRADAAMLSIGFVSGALLLFLAYML